MKLFRNCPQEGRESCEGCPRLGRCIVRKLKRRFVKKTKAFFRKVEIFYCAVWACAGRCGMVK